MARRHCRDVVLSAWPSRNRSNGFAPVARTALPKPCFRRYDLLVLEGASTATLERVASQLRACLIKLASHPLAEARQSGRACFWAFSRHFPDTMRGTLPPPSARPPAVPPSSVASSCLRACRAAPGSGAQGGGSGTSVAAGRPGVRVRTHATPTRRPWALPRMAMPPPAMAIAPASPSARSPRCGANGVMPRGKGTSRLRPPPKTWRVGGRGDARTVATDRGRRLG